MPNNQLITSYSDMHIDARESLDHKAYTYYAFIGSGNVVGAVFDVKEAGRSSKETKEASLATPGVHQAFLNRGLCH